MGIVHRGQSARWLLGASLALLAFALPVPPTARAGCGHSLGASSGPIHLEALADAGALAPTPDATPADPPGEPPPCPGGTCSRTPTTPATPTPSLAVSAPQWAVLTDGPAPPSPGRSHLPRDDAFRRPQNRGLPLFHPPRPL